MQITDERKKRVIDLYFNQYKSYAEIAQIEKMSPRDIHAIIKEEETRRQKHKDQQQQEEKSSKAYEFFSKRKTTVEVAIELNLRESEATKYYREYWKLKGLHKLNSIYQATDGKLWTFLKLHKQLIKEKGMSVNQVVHVIDITANRLTHMESLYEQARDESQKMKSTMQHFSNEIAASKYKISLIDKIAFTSEQDSRRTEQEIKGT